MDGGRTRCSHGDGSLHGSRAGQAAAADSEAMSITKR
ncbi:hypothetical protein AvCA_32380 [Azotobacter vinelandii CA]|uniref:Uncharacterized protein n=2 Tax=Azotobacter vinelandii TaxID=354 RepID=C1DP44_AZOVD|nr:hypothetical protein Avin_32380 [Azotobacter vinelandii DJ]AGK14701.1 hypothetical protein AvCA_32380 [Azotobacter vinelandii CA]AGK21189.1 hypothetical protein AvCA6_32380 [Azotobacter vinelandii CA6]